MKIATYDTNCTDAQWDYLKPMLLQPAKFGRPPKDGRRLIEAILFLVKCGCPWRYLAPLPGSVRKFNNPGVGVFLQVLVARQLVAIGFE